MKVDTKIKEDFGNDKISLLGYVAVIVIGTGLSFTSLPGSTVDSNANSLSNASQQNENVIQKSGSNDQIHGHSNINTQEESAGIIIHGKSSDVSLGSISIYKKENSTQATLKIYPSIASIDNTIKQRESNDLMTYLGGMSPAFQKMESDSIVNANSNSKAQVLATISSLESNGIIKHVKLDGDGNISPSVMEKAVKGALSQTSRAYDLSARNGVSVLSSSSKLDIESFVASVDGSNQDIFTVGVNLHQQNSQLAKM